MEAEFQDYETNGKWKKIFRNMTSMSKTFSNKESRKPENKVLNRYMDVVPYDDTRVKLKRNDLNYINASHVCVQSANRKYILTQGPLPITSGHFWLMVWEQNTKAIMMLNNLIEHSCIKCHKYWPNGSAQNDVDEMSFDDVSLTVELMSTKKYTDYIVRSFKLNDLLSNTSREVLHFHYTSFEDFGLPVSTESFLNFLYAVRDSGSLDSNQYGPAVIHCSAGIGRSGTFVLIDSCLVMIENNKCRDSVNIIDILLEMRNYRMGLIQTADQLRFSFQAIIEGSKKLVPVDQCPATTNNKIHRLFGMVDNDGTNEETDELQAHINNNKIDIVENDANSPMLSNHLDLVGNSNDKSHLNEMALRSRITNTKNNNASSDNSSNNNQTIKTNNNNNNNDEREEKRRKTLETIQRIKRKQKEVEERFDRKDGGKRRKVARKK